MFYVLKYFVKKIRVFFTNESINEIFDIFKSKLNPVDSSIALFTLSLFFKVNNKVPIENYQSILNQIMEIKGWKTCQGFEDYFNFLIYRFTL